MKTFQFVMLAGAAMAQIIAYSCSPEGGNPLSPEAGNQDHRVNGPAFAGTLTATTITSPTSGAIVNTGTVMKVTATAVDPDGVDLCRLWIDDVYHSTAAAPFEFYVTNLAAGNHTLMVRATDRLGNKNDSPDVPITVQQVIPKVTFVGAGKAARWDAGTMTVQASSNTKGGDLMVLFLGASDTTPLTELSGWTQIITKGPTDISLTVLMKKYLNGDTKTFSVGVHHASFATLVTLRGVDPLNPVVDKEAYKDWGITSQTQNGTGTPKGTSYAPSVASVANGMLLNGFMWDDFYANCAVNDGTVIFSYSNGDDGLTTAYDPTAGGETGIRFAKAPAEVSGGGNEIGISVSFRPAN